MKDMLEERKYSLRLDIDRERSVLALIRGGEVQREVSWPERRDTAQKLLEGIRDLLKAEGLPPEDIASLEVKSELPESATALRIAETVALVYTFGVASRKSA